MTQNQIAYGRLVEENRANEVREKEIKRQYNDMSLFNKIGAVAGSLANVSKIIKPVTGLVSDISWLI